MKFKPSVMSQEEIDDMVRKVEKERKKLEKEKEVISIYGPECG